ncbi:MAG: TolB family protein [Marinifilaceae bacterium]
MRVKFLGFLVLACLFVNAVFAQEGVDGNPVSVKWFQINTDTVRIIFPEYMSKKAQRVSDYVHHLAANNTESLGGKVRKLNIVLQANTSTPNGYVSVAPYKSEFYCTNPQDPYMVGGDDFIDVLSVHEYRHALQFANTKRGFGQVLYLLQGENGWSMISNLTVPAWFFEGDAVVNETAVTNGGRGRLAAFQQNNHANWQVGKHFKYKQMRMGSFQNQMPNHYEYGYLLCSYLRDEYGNDIWAKVLNNTMRLRGLVYPFSNALRLHTGMSTRQLYEKAYTHYRDEYQKQIAQIDMREGKKITKEAKEITNYTFPTYVGEDLYALKSSYSTIPEIVKISSGGVETHICYPSITANSGFSIANGRITWTESTPHPRWTNYNYSDVVVYDIVSGKKTKRTKRARFFSPQLSADASKIAVVEFTPEQVCSLVILDANTGEEIKRLDNKDNDYLMYPKWINEHEIICSGRKKGKFNISIFDIRKNTEKLVWGPMNQVVSDIEVVNGKYYFSATFSGIDNIFAFNPMDGKVTQISSVPVGAFWPTLSSDGQTLVYSSVKAEGSELRKLSLDQSLNKETEVIALHQMPEFDNVAIKSEGGSIIDEAVHRKDSIEKYNRLGHLIHVHSWGYQASNTAYGLSLKSDNALNTLGASANYIYNVNEKSNTLDANLTYAGFWVKTIASFSMTTERELGYFQKNEFDEKEGRLSFVLPLNLSSGIYHRQLSLSTGVSGHTIDFKINNSGLEDYSFADYNLGLSFYNLRRSAYKNIGCRWGQSLTASYYKSFQKDRAEELEATARFYLPGLMRNHNLELASAYKWKGTPYGYTDRFEYARGYSTPGYKRILSLTADYNLPIAYPEFGINGVFYSNRLSAKLFGDYNITDFNDSETRREYASMGFETLFDVLIANMVNAKVGFRQSFLLNRDYNTSKTGDSRFEMVFRIGL